LPMWRFLQIKSVRAPNGHRYYIIRDVDGKCAFLDADGKCIIEEIKPLDCRCYPLKAVYKYKRQITVFLDMSPEQAKKEAQPLLFQDLDWNSLSQAPQEILLSDRLKIVVDSQCPAIKDLSPEFFREAIRVSVMSITRFDRITYQHWLDNHIGWLKGAFRLEEFFPSLGA